MGKTHRGALELTDVGTNSGLFLDTANTVAPSSEGQIAYVSGTGIQAYVGGVITLGAAGAAGTVGLDDAYDDGRSMTVDAGAVTLTGTDEDTAVLAITGDGDSAGALIKCTHTTATRNDILGTGSTWSVTGQGYATLVRAFVSGYVSTASAADLTLHTNSGTNSSKMVITDGLNGDITFTMNGTGALKITGTTEANNGLELDTGDFAIADGSLTITDDDDAAALAVTSTGNVATGIVAIIANSVTSGHVLDITGDGITTGKILHLDMTEAGVTDGTGMYIECYDNTADAAQFTVGANGDVRIAGADSTDVVTIDLGDVVLTQGSITITDDNDNATTLSVTNDTATSADVVDMNSGSLTTGSLVHLTADTAALITTGSVLEITADAATTAGAGGDGRGVVTVSVDALTTGIGMNITSLSNEALAGGILFQVEHSYDGSGDTAITAAIINVESSVTESGTTTQNYDVIKKD